MNTHRRQGVRRRLSAAVAGLLILGCRHVGPARRPGTMDAPYDRVTVTVTEGQRQPDPARAAALAAAAVRKGVTYVARQDGEIRPSEDAKLLELKVDQPDDVSVISAGKGRGVLATVEAMSVLSRVTAGSQTRMTDANVALTSASAGATVSLASSAIAVGQENLRGDMVVTAGTEAVTTVTDSGRLDVASDSQSVATSGVRGAMTVETESGRMARSGAKAGMAVASDSRNVAQSGVAASMALASGAGQLERSEATGGMAVSSDTRATARVDTHAGVAVQAGETAIDGAAATGSMNMQQGSARVEGRRQATGGLKVIEGRVALDKGMTLFALQEVGVDYKQRVAVLTRFGSLSDMTDLGNVSELDDSGILELLEDLGMVDGFYDSGNNRILLDTSEIIADETVSRLLAELRANGTVTRYAGGQLALIFEPRVTGKADVSLKAVARQERQKLYHGSSLIVLLTLRNSGSEPLRDLICFLPVPEHTNFNRFLVRHFRGFVNGVFAEDRLLFWRLYRPLEPGETFKSVFVLDLDRWELGE
ncbi:MAG: hypothetical protein HN742_18935 [Lentisphaerae bacterium]|jgi:hypothetical protein|nr:hypothetical protein [Lentisphaerota bacterium]MBT7058241.1 hypothetical protein [Lentisphaerota bacterium]MBT7843962.1 hypothetical protein [Lentisphaerota bacterium]